jgi:hypothetical protein
MTVHDLFILLGTPCDVENNVYSAAVGEMFYECPLALECSFSVMIVDFPLRVICPLLLLCCSPSLFLDLVRSAFYIVCSCIRCTDISKYYIFILV